MAGSFRIQSLTPYGVSPEAAKRAVDILKQALDRPIPIEANEQFLEMLCEGVTLTIDGQDRTLTLRGHHYDHPEVS